MKRQATAILLPMEKETNLFRDSNGKLFHSIGCDPQTGHSVNSDCIGQQLIIVDDSVDFEGKGLANGIIYDIDYSYWASYDKMFINPKKIIAAYPLIPNIPPISPSFIQSYAEANGKGKVWVDYEVCCDGHCDGTCTVTKNGTKRIYLDPHGCAVLELREEMKEEKDFVFKPKIESIPVTIQVGNKPVVDNSSDAIEFAEWIANEGWDYDDTEMTWANLVDGTISIKTTHDLYSLFKSNTQHGTGK